MSAIIKLDLYTVKGDIMKIKLEQGSLTTVECDVIIVNLFEGVKTPGGATGAVDKALDGLISKYIIEKDNFEGKFGTTYTIPTYGKIPADKVLLVGLGKQEDFDLNKLRHLSSKVINKCKSFLKAKKICSILHGAGTGGLDAFDCARAITEGVLIGGYEFNKYKSSKDKKDIEFTIVELDENIANEAKKGLELGHITADATNFARDLVNEPAEYATPSKLAEIAQSIEDINTKIIEKDEAEKLGMGSYLAVAKGSSQPPKFIHMKYTPKENCKKKIAIIGKGVTFDSGGLDLKPPASMKNMKDDMSGSATVIAIMKHLSMLNPEIEVHGIIAATENMPGANAYKPGDVLTAMNGKTIEVDNTDAEGRLTMADALCYAEKLGVDEIIDIATLTGACLVALGHMASGIMGTNQAMIDKLIESGHMGGERLWALPLYDEYKDDLKSDIADFKNSGSRYAGASSAGMFLKEFVDNTPWVHIDIAGPAFLKKPVRELSKGPSGAGVRTLINYILNV